MDAYSHLLAGSGRAARKRERGHDWHGPARSVRGFHGRRCGLTSDRSQSQHRLPRLDEFCHRVNKGDSARSH